MANIGDTIQYVSRFSGEKKEGVIEEKFPNMEHSYFCYFLEGVIELVTEMQIIDTKASKHSDNKYSIS